LWSDSNIDDDIGQMPFMMPSLTHRSDRRQWDLKMNLPLPVLLQVC